MFVGSMVFWKCCKIVVYFCEILNKTNQITKIASIVFVIHTHGGCKTLTIAYLMPVLHKKISQSLRVSPENPFD